LPVGITLHRHLYQLVLDGPGGALGDAKAAAKFDAGDAQLALGQVLQGAKPDPQFHLGRHEDGAGDQRHLPPTDAALEQAAGLDLAVRRAAADRAFEALGPTLGERHFPALRFGAVEFVGRRLAEALLTPYRIPSRRLVPPAGNIRFLCHKTRG
jgi:hypothetical protein